jgi:cytochrome b subunit of formate dehydrogenase
MVIAGHLKMAFSDGDALRGMTKGWVPTTWARRHRPKWYEAMTGHAATAPTAPPSAPPASVAIAPGADPPPAAGP